MAKKSKTEMKQTMTRAICLALAALMIVSMVMAAAMSQIY